MEGLILMAKRRRATKRSWGRNTFAILWIALAGVSGFYLFTLLTDPAALGGTVQRTANAGASPAAAPPPPSAPPVMAAPPTADGLTKKDMAVLKSALQGLSQQVGQIDARLKPIEQFIGPVAALPPSNSVSTSPPAPQPPQTGTPAAAAVEEVVVEETSPPPPPPTPAPPPIAAATEPAPEPEPKPTAEPEPAPPPPPPVVAAAPEPEPAPPAASEAPQTPPSDAAVAAETEVEIATFDPVMLPPSANDGSTRYGIEIGAVAKRDELRPLWREYLTKHAALVAGLQPRRVLAPDKKWRLIAGPFANARDAEGACTLFKKADRPCAATVYAGDAL